jgi:hypothetical protein
VRIGREDAHLFLDLRRQPEIVAAEPRRELAASARLQLTVMPALAGARRSWIRGSCRAISATTSAVPSVEASSATTIWRSS